MMKNKKVLVEYFDGDNLDNCISLACEKYGEAVYFYFPGDISPRSGQYLAAATAFARKMTGSEPRFIRIDEPTPEAVIRAARERLPDDGSEYHFDITGGSEIYLLAVGVICGMRLYRNISVRRYDVRRGEAVFSYPAGAGGRASPMKIPELLSLFGAAAGEGSGAPDASEATVLRYWDALRNIPHLWNRFAMQKQIFRTVNGSAAVLKRVNEGRDGPGRVYEALRRAGLAGERVALTEDGKEYEGFTIDPSGGALALYAKAGRLLELYAYYTAFRTGAFADCKTGLQINLPSDPTPDLPGNEIDLVLSAGTYPVFVSCKNTAVSNEALYEIKSLSAFYGGKYAKPVILSGLDQTPGTRARAESLGIGFVGGAANMSRDEFAAKLTSAAKE